MSKSGYVNGSDLLVYVADVPASGSSVSGQKAIGHCTSHTANFNTETKDVAVKPAASQAMGDAGLYKQKRVTGLSVQVKCDGLHFYGETEGGFKELLAKWKAGEPVYLELFERKESSESAAPSPYCHGQFIISSLENTAPAGEDASYTATFDNDGAVEFDTTKLS